MDVFLFLLTLSYSTSIVISETWKEENINLHTHIKKHSGNFDVSLSLRISLTDCISGCFMNAHPSFFYHKTAGLCKCHASIIDIDTDETADDKSQIYGFYLLGYQSLTFGSFKKWHVLPTQRDCLSLYHRGFVEDGVYLIYPINGTGVATWCDMTNGGWTVIQRRQDGQEDFYRTWDEYMAGFGNATGEYWLGLENIYTLTQSPSSLYIEMETFGDATPVSAYATYSSFTVHDVSANYTLYVDGFTGNCGDSLGTQFSTLDRDNDEASSKSCAVTYSGAWWYKSCHISNLNGLYLFGNFSSTSRGVVWRTCWGYNYSVKKVVMKVKKKLELNCFEHRR